MVDGIAQFVTMVTIDNGEPYNETISYRVTRRVNPKTANVSANIESALFVILMLQKLPPPEIDLQQKIASQFDMLVWIIIACSILLFFIIWALILRFTKKITYPIQ